jgi:hypothetical protein
LVDSFSNILKKNFTWKNFFLLIVILLLLPEHIINLQPIGIDASWEIGLNIAFKNGLTFGRDIIFTYGPLGFLSTHNSSEITHGNLWILLFDLVLLGLIVYLINRSTKGNNSLVVYGLIYIAVYNLTYAQSTWRLLIIVLYFIIRGIKEYDIFSQVVITLLLVLQFFIKPSAAIFFIVIFIVSSLYLTICGKRWAWLFPVALVMMIFILSFPLKVDLKGYIVTTFDFSRTYSEAMSRMAVRGLKYTMSMFSALNNIISFLIIALISIIKKKKTETILMSGIVGLYIFFFFKQGYVRLDSSHLLAFWSIALSMFLIYFQFETDLKNRLTKYLFIWIIIVTIASFSFFSKFEEGKYPLPLPVGYLTELFSKSYILDYHKAGVKSYEMPETVFNKIKQGTVDVIPYDICSVYFNGLNYKPRPVIQSYAASSDISNRYNSDFFKRKDSPRYIIFENGSLDNRYPFWDESQTKNTLLSEYIAEDSLFIWKEKMDTSFLLTKREQPLHLTSRQITDTLIEINSKYIIPEKDNLLIMSADIKYNMTGKLKNILYRPSFINIRLFYADGGSGIYRLILPELKHGVIINKKLISTLDSYSLFRSLGKRNENITGFTIIPEKNDYQSQFRIKITEYSYN